MNLEEACKTIAFYDGYRDAFNPCGGTFEKHPEVNRYLIINNLIPVWQKMKRIGFNIRFDVGEEAPDDTYFLIDSVHDEYSRKMPPASEFSHSLVIATALAINELEKDKK